MGYELGRNKVVKKSPVTKTKSKQTVESILSLPYADLSHRGITEEACRLFNVRMSLSPEDGVTPTSVYFPYYDQKGELCGWKDRKSTRLNSSHR